MNTRLSRNSIWSVATLWVSAANAISRALIAPAAFFAAMPLMSVPDVAALGIEIALAHIERVEPERPGDFVDGALGHHHSLRAAESAERRVRDRIGLHALGRDLGGGKKVGVVGVEHGAIVDRSRYIGRIAAPRGHRGLKCRDAALGVKADL